MNDLCTVVGCFRIRRTRTWCPTHYKRWRKWGDPNIDGNSVEHRLKRCLAPLPTSDTCWEWQGGMNHAGYGLFHIDNRNVLAHRFMYEMLVGPIPEGLVIDHLCSNRVCIRPDHLEAVTQVENIRRTNARGRGRAGKRYPA